MRRPRTWLRIICATALLGSALRVAAQDYDEEDDEEVPRTAVLSIYVQQDATARIEFYSPRALNELPELREALGSVLLCNSAAFQTPKYPAAATGDPRTQEQLRRAERQVALHQLTAVCPSPVRRSQMQSSLDLSLAPVIAEMKRNHFDALSVTIYAGETPNLQFGEGSLSTIGARRYGLTNFLVRVDSGPTDIRLMWGYQTSGLAGPLVTAAAFILFPVAIILWMRSRALHLHTTDRAGAWFSYIHAQQLCLTGVLLVWIGGGYSMRHLFSQILSSAWGPHSLRVAMLVLAYVMLPPLTVLLVSVLSSYRVLVEVRQVEWTFRDFLQLQLARVGILMIPALGIYACISLIGISDLVAIATVTLSLLFLPVAVYLRKKLTGTHPEPVTSGELLDRIMLLARRAGVAMKSVFILPSGKLPVANAYAAGNGTVMVTDYIVQKLNRREVEAVVAHEIGHLQYKHPQKLGAALIAVIFVPIAFRTLIPAFVDIVLLAWPGKTSWSILGENALAYPALDFLVAGLCLLGFYAISRRFERIADARSVTLTDDPEALITSFVKLSVLNLTPMQWGRASGTLVTHPSMLRRIRRIAHVGNVPEQRLQELLADPKIGDDAQAAIERFESPLGTTKARVYSAHQQLQRANLNLLILVLVSTAIPTVFAHWAGRSSGSQLATLALGVVATFALYMATVRWRIVSGRAELKQKFVTHFKKLHPELDFSNARLVGYSPEAWPRFYYVQSHLDTGLLIPTRDAVLFLGDMVKFRLPYSAIQELVFDQGISSWWKFRRSYLRWVDGESRGVMNLLSLEPCSPFAIEKGNQQLHESLERWRTDCTGLPTPPAELASLPVPQPIAWKSKHPSDAYPLKAIWKLVAFAFLAGVVISNSTATFWPLWYVPGVVFLLRFVESIPYRRYKDRPLSSAWTTPSAPVENKVSTQSTN